MVIKTIYSTKKLIDLLKTAIEQGMYFPMYVDSLYLGLGVARNHIDSGNVVVFDSPRLLEVAFYDTLEEVAAYKKKKKFGQAIVLDSKWKEQENNV